MSSEVSSKFNQIRQLHPSNLTDQEIYNILEQCQFNVAKAILQVMIRGEDLCFFFFCNVLILSHILFLFYRFLPGIDHKLQFFFVFLVAVL